MTSQLIYILRQTGKHDTGTCTLLIEGFHHLAQTALTKQRLNAVLVEVRILDML